MFAKRAIAMRLILNVLALEGVSSSALATADDFASVCKRLAQRIGPQAPLLEVRRVSVTGTDVRGANGRLVQVDADLDSIKDRELLYIPAPLVADTEELCRFLSAEATTIDWLSHHGRKQEQILTHCAASFLVADAGLLDAGTAATAWYLEDAFAERYGKRIRVSSELISIHRNLVTAGAASAHQDMLLLMVSQRMGKHFARLLAKYLLLDNQRQSQQPYKILAELPQCDDFSRAALSWLRKHLAQELRIEHLAEAMQVSQRTLIRKLRSGCGESPQSLLQKLRIEKSKTLLETTALPVDSIVGRVGYQDESAFRRQFTRYVALSPKEYRRLFSSSHADSQPNALAPHGDRSTAEAL